MPRQARMPEQSRISVLWSQYGRAILVLCVFALFIHDIFGTHGFLAMRRTKLEIERVQKDINRLAKEINTSPAVAAAHPHFPFGKIDNLPYTNSICTQYTSNDVRPNCSTGLNPACANPHLYHACAKLKITSITPHRARRKFGLVCQ